MALTYRQRICNQRIYQLFCLVQSSVDRAEIHVQLNILMQKRALFHKLSKTKKSQKLQTLLVKCFSAHLCTYLCIPWDITGFSDFKVLSY